MPQHVMLFTYTQIPYQKRDLFLEVSGHLVLDTWVMLTCLVFIISIVMLATKLWVFVWPAAERTDWGDSGDQVVGVS